MRSFQNENAQVRIDLFIKELKEDLDKTVESIVSNAKAKLTERRELLAKLDEEYSRISSFKELKLAVLSNNEEGDLQLETIIQNAWDK